MVADDAAEPVDITAVIATVHRPDDVVRAVESVLRSRGPRFEVVVVDQSGGDEVRAGLATLGADPRVRYTSMPGRGLSAALNVGIDLARAPLAAITGDDCVVPDDWLEQTVRAFARDPRIAVVFGSVASAPCDPATGFVPGCVIDGEFLAERRHDGHRLSGTTACMAVRKAAWRELGGFDERLGVGAPLRSAEDIDLALRVLGAGWRVLQTPAVEAVHRTPVAWKDRSTVVRRNWYGSGAAFAKSLKLAAGPTAAMLLGLVRRWVGGGSGVAATYGPKPDRVSMLVGFATGLAVGFATPVDRKTGHFRADPRLRLGSGSDA